MQSIATEVTYILIPSYLHVP